MPGSTFKFIEFWWSYLYSKYLHAWLIFFFYPGAELLTAGYTMSSLYYLLVTRELSFILLVISTMSSWNYLLVTRELSFILLVIQCLLGTIYWLPGS